MHIWLEWFEHDLLTDQMAWQSLAREPYSHNYSARLLHAIRTESFNSIECERFSMQCNKSILINECARAISKPIALKHETFCLS